MRHVGDLVPLFRKEFELCRIGEGELVALLTEATTRPEYVAAAAGAARSLGAETFELSVGNLGWDAPATVLGMGMGVASLARESRLTEAIAGALGRADVVIDLIPETIIHTPLRGQLQAAGARILTVVEPPDALERLLAPPGIKRSVLAMAARMRAADTLRVLSDAGTDVTFNMQGARAIAQYGFADEPGRWDHWPSALVAAYPVDGETSGTVVLQPGDIVFPFKRHVEAPVTLEVREGYVESIEGGTDAFLLREYLESWEEPEVFATSHVGLGMLPRARWSAMAVYDKRESVGMDGRSAAGSFLFSTGPNRFTGRLVEAHLDIPLHSCTVLLDGEVIVEAGRPLAAEYDGRVDV